MHAQNGSVTTAGLHELVIYRRGAGKQILNVSYLLVEFAGELLGGKCLAESKH